MKKAANLVLRLLIYGFMIGVTNMDYEYPSGQHWYWYRYHY